jgi:hypothetical protein
MKTPENFEDFEPLFGKKYNKNTLLWCGTGVSNVN